MKKLTSLILSLFIVQFAFSQTSTFSGSGNWSSSGRWNNGVPNSSTAAIIANNSSCTIDITNATCASLVIQTGNRATTLTISSGKKLTVVGNTTIQISTSDGRTKKIDVSSGTLDVGGSITIDNPSNTNRAGIV